MYVTHVDYNVTQTFADLTQTSQKNTKYFSLRVTRVHIKFCVTHITNGSYLIVKVTTITTYCFISKK